MYELTVWHDGEADTSRPGTFEELSAAIDRAWGLPGFVRYTVGPATR